MRCDANVNRQHMTNGFQLRTFDLEAELQAFEVVAISVSANSSLDFRFAIPIVMQAIN